MTVGLSATNTINVWLNWFRGTNATAPTALYIKLHTADPGSAGATAAAAGSTTRVVVTEAAPSGSAIAMTGTAPSWTNGGTSETLSHISIWDASTSGNFLASAALSSTQAWVSGNVFTLSTLGISISPTAA